MIWFLFMIVFRKLIQDENELKISWYHYLFIENSFNLLLFRWIDVASLRINKSYVSQQELIWIIRSKKIFEFVMKSLSIKNSEFCWLHQLRALMKVYSPSINSSVTVILCYETKSLNRLNFFLISFFSF